MPVYSQIDRKNCDWQEQILQQIDPDEFSEQQYAQLLEQLDEIDQNVPDTNHFRTYQQLLLRADRCLNQCAGYSAVSAQNQGKGYLGDPWHHTLRYRMDKQDGKERRWGVGLVLDKDAGEAWQKRPPFADSFSAYAVYSSDKGILRQAVIGHYRLQLGSGLILNQQFTMGKNLIGSGFLRQSPRLTPHSSANESNHMQGAALCLRLGNHLEILPFVSLQQIDGTLVNDTLTSWSTDGYHRTQNETAKRHNAWLTNIGMRTQVMGEWWEVGGNLLSSHFEYDYVRPMRQYNHNYFRGHQLTQGSIDYRLLWYGFQMRGEAAIDDQGNIATIHGIYHSIGKSMKGTILYRYYSNKYRQLWAAAMAESSSMQGEQGATMMLEGDLAHHWNLQCTADYWNFQQAQYGCYQPSWGYELSARVVHPFRISRMPAQISFRYRIKAKQKNDNETSDPDDIFGYYTHSLDGTLQFEVLSGLQLKTQARGRFYNRQKYSKYTSTKGGMDSPEYGMALSEAIVWQHADSPIKGELQGAWFHADNYNCRLYLTERNILYGYNLPMLYGEGVRYTATLSYKISERIQAEAKYAFTNYKSTPSIGSGLQEIAGNSKHDLWLQLIGRF